MLLEAAAVCSSVRDVSCDVCCTTAAVCALQCWTCCSMLTWFRNIQSLSQTGLYFQCVISSMSLLFAAAGGICTYCRSSGDCCVGL